MKTLLTVSRRNGNSIWLDSVMMASQTAAHLAAKALLKVLGKDVGGAFDMKVHPGLPEIVWEGKLNDELWRIEVSASFIRQEVDGKQLFSGTGFPCWLCGRHRLNHIGKNLECPVQKKGPNTGRIVEEHIPELHQMPEAIPAILLGGEASHKPAYGLGDFAAIERRVTLHEGHAALYGGDSVKLVRKVRPDHINALFQLYYRIKQGAEFPDACGATAALYGVDYDKLRQNYDDMEAGAFGERLRPTERYAEQDGGTFYPERTSGEAPFIGGLEIVTYSTQDGNVKDADLATAIKAREAFLRDFPEYRCK